ncbi:MAG: helix-turn-helix transcriptional regulator [Eubacteriales bacterium]|nr:helix-turn-helix transcriptional regulator [Eubacteriales bacterium]
MTSISQRIEELRSKKGISRPAMAAALGFPKISIEKFETGRLTPNQEQQKKMAEYFGVSVEYLRGESNDPTTMDNWLSGNVPDDEPVVEIKPQKKTVVATAESGNNDTAPLTALLRSDAFKALVRETVVEVLRSKEGQQLIAKAMTR